MKTNLKDGGPAFPVAGYDHQTFQPDNVAESVRLMSGMSMRQHYAGLAMQAMVSSISDEEGYLRLRDHALMDSMTVSQWIARDSFKQADAMLAAGEKPSELERITAERDALARAALNWWARHQDDEASDGVVIYADEPELVILAIATGVEP